MNPVFPLLALRAFTEVGRHGSIKRAAAALGVTSGAVSQQVRLLEERVGLPLFTRGRQSMALTEAGARVHPGLLTAFDQIESALRTLEAARARKTLTVSTMASFAASWLVPRLGRFTSRHPDIEVRVEAVADLVDLHRDRVDIAIRHGLGSYPGLQSRPLMAPVLLPVASPALLADGPPIREPADCLAYPLLQDGCRADWGLWLAAHGVAVKLLTGDNELVAAKVCRDVGLPADHIVLGTQIEHMNDEMLRQTVERHQLFARLTPLHKERIVHALRANGHITGFMGDGINDAPALRAADIGISVDSAVDIAKEAADIILLEKSLMVLEQGVIEGRRTFSNMLKYIRMTASSNFGNVFSVMVASAFIPFLPMLPLHLLVQNLLYDLSQIAIPFDNVDDELVRQPLRWNPADLGRFMVFFGPISSLFDILTFALMWFVFAANTPGQQTLFQSGWFVIGLLTQTLIVHMIRTPRIPFLQSRPSWPLLLATAAVMAAGIFLPMGPLAGYLKLQALPAAYFPWMIAILLGYACLATLLKRVYIRRYGWQ